MKLASYDINGTISIVHFCNALCRYYVKLYTWASACSNAKVTLVLAEYTAMDCGSLVVRDT